MSSISDFFGNSGIDDIKGPGWDSGTDTLENLYNKVDTVDTTTGTINSTTGTIDSKVDTINTTTGTINSTTNTINGKVDTINSTTSTTDSKVDTINTTTGTINTTTSTTDSKVDTINTTTNTINGKVDTINSTTSTTDSKVDTINTTTGIINGKVDTINTTTGTINTTTSTTDSKVDTINTTTNTIDGKVDTINTTTGTTDSKVDTINTTTGTINSTVNTINGKVDTINTTTGTINSTTSTTDGKVDTVNSTVNTINGKVDTLDSKVDSIGGELSAVTITNGAGENITINDIVSINENKVRKFVIAKGETFFEQTATYNKNIAMLTSTKAILIYGTSSTKACILEVSGNNITVGSPVVVSAEIYSSQYSQSIATISSTQAIAVYKSTSEYIAANILTVSGTTITVNTAYTIFPNAAFEPNVGVLSSTRAVMACRYRYSAGQPAAVLLSISGTTISVLNTTNIEGSISSTSFSIAGLDATKAIVAYKLDANLYGRVRIIDITGDALAFGALNYYDLSVASYYYSVKKLTASKAIIAYKDTNNVAKASVLDVSGTTITPGVPHIFEDSGTVSELFSMDTFSATKAITIYNDTANSLKGQVCVLHISGSTISSDTPYIFTDAQINKFSIAVLDTSKIIVAHTDVNNRNFGASISLGLPFVYSIAGVADATVTTGNNITITIDNVKGGFSGLSIGVKYYLNNLGALTTTPTRFLLGIAISTTEIFLNGKQFSFKSNV